MPDQIAGQRHEWKRTANGEIDEYGFDGDQHHGPKCVVCGDFLSTCCDPAEWAAVLAGRYEETEDHWCEGPHRRVWTLPAEPRAEVLSLSDGKGDRWDRSEFAGWWQSGSRSVTWAMLLTGFGPLTEVSAEYNAWLAKGDSRD